MTGDDLNSAMFGTVPFGIMNLERARRILASVATCNVEPIRTTVIQGIRDYHNRTRPPSA